MLIKKKRERYTKKGKLLSAYSVIEFGVLFGFDWCVCVLIANREEQERKKEKKSATLTILRQ